MSVNPEEKLQQLKDELQEKEMELSKVTKNKDWLKSDITNLEKIVEDLKQVLSAYKQALPVIHKEKDEIEKYYNSKGPMIDAAIKEGKETVDKTIKQADDEISAIESEIQSLKKKRDTAEKNSEGAQNDLKKKEQKYNTLKDCQKKLGDNLKELKNLKDRIEKEEEKTKTANMYFLFSQLSALLKMTKDAILDEETLKSSLIDAWDELDKAKKDLREKEDQLKSAEVELLAKEKTFELTKKNRQQEILKLIDKL